MRVLVCVKRIPDVAGEVMLTADEQAVDARFVGYTVSNHESSAVELAIRVADATGGSVTLATVGPAESTEQLRHMLGLGCHAATLVEADPVALGPADVARELAAVVTDHAGRGGPDGGYDLVLLGNDAADSGDFQVGIRLAYALGWPVVNGVSTVETAEGHAITKNDGPDGEETFSVPLPAVVTVLEGGVEPRYPTLKGRMAAKKVEIETRALSAEPTGASRVRLVVPPPAPSIVEVLGEGPEAAAAVVDLFERLGVLR
jgi:electron transfer flavoprotein beta subunit